MPDRIEGDPAFQKAFLASAPRSAGGGSLKDFQLKGHLFRNRCSYLIYSEAFLALPDPLKRRVYTRLARILLPNNADSTYAYLGSDERVRILDILRETHPELLKYLPARN